MPRNVNLA